MMRSRSSRLFIVLLHLVGVSTNLPPKLWDWGVGIVGVHPVAISLERLDVEAAGGLDGLLSRLREAGIEPDGLLAEPYWLQDDFDGKCMGPEGFSECGDATLWLLRRRPLRGVKGSGKRRGIWGKKNKNKNKNKRSHPPEDGEGEETVWAYALQLVDADLLLSSEPKSFPFIPADGGARRRRKQAPPTAGAGAGARATEGEGEAECLVPRPWGASSSSSSSSSRGARRGDKRRRSGASASSRAAGVASEAEEALALGSCESDGAWTWRIDGDGWLVRDDDDAARAGEGTGTGTKRGNAFLGIYASVGDGGGGAAAAAQRDGDGGAVGDENETSKPAPVVRCVRRAGSRSVVAPCSPVPPPTPAGEEDGTAGGDAADSSALILRSPGTPQTPTGRPVRFSLVRYRTASAGAAVAKLPKLSPQNTKVGGKGSAAADGVGDRGASSSAPPADKQERERAKEERGEGQAEEEGEEEESHLPHRSSSASRSQGGPAQHQDLRPSSQLLFSTAQLGTAMRKQQQAQAAESSSSQQKKKPLSSLPKSAAVGMGAAAGAGTMKAKATSSGAGAAVGEKTTTAPKNLLHRPAAPASASAGGTPIKASASSGPGKVSPGAKVGGGGAGGAAPPRDDAVPHRPRKIPTHPYIAASRDGRFWEDPSTGLRYLTDLSEYLGHERKSTGRHTLMGVGQYTRTVFNIKVYGCAFYVAKRDVLADPGYAPFATLTAEELRSHSDFYSLIMGPDTAVDRTILLKLNMQLATETMRTSLDADWALMTPSLKEMLISSSFKSRPAEEAMLKKIESDENSSNCSCGQSAPDEYGADPACCARGTDLVFTWRKDGTFELRLDGRLMDAFPDNPELAGAIFHEYFRGDDPMSWEARDNFVDGFPFLLAPLAQVKGVTSPVHKNQQHGEERSGGRQPKKEHTGPFKLFHEAADAVQGAAAGPVGWVRTNAENAASGVMGAAGAAAKAAENAARGAMAEAERRRDEAWRAAVSAIPEPGRRLLASVPFMGGGGGEKEREEERDRTESLNVFKLRVLNGDGSTTEFSDGGSNRSQLQRMLAAPGDDDVSKGRRSGSSNSGGMPSLSDEIGIVRNPAMNFTHQLFLYTVHFYLMLLLIVSVPGSYTTRLVVRRPGSIGGRRKEGEYSDEENEDLKHQESVTRREQFHGGERKGSGGALGFGGLVEVSLRVQLGSRENLRQDPEGSAKGMLERNRHYHDDRSPQTQLEGEDTSESKVTQMKKALSYYL